MSDFPSRIVCVDDDSESRKLVKAGLKESGAIVVTCESGQELLDRLQELQPSLVLMDLLMKGMSGPDLLGFLQHHKHGKDLRVIFLTGHSKISMLDNYKHLGVIGVIRKPWLNSV